jgi:hypothetical protein
MIKMAFCFMPYPLQASGGGLRLEAQQFQVRQSNAGQTLPERVVMLGQFLKGGLSRVGLSLDDMGQSQAILVKWAQVGWRDQVRPLSLWGT